MVKGLVLMETNMKRDEHEPINGERRRRRVDGDGTDFVELGLMYTVGSSVPVDYVSAHKWFNLSASRGNPAALAYRIELAREMSSEQVAEAQKLAREWIQTN